MANKDITLKRKTASGTDNLNPTTTWTQVNDKPTTFAPTAHTHDVDDIDASGTASNTTYLRGDGAWVSLSSSSGLTFVGTIDLSVIGGANGDGLASAGLTSPGDYLIVSATGVINNDGSPLVTLSVQTPGDEGDSTLPVTLETGDWILYESASGTTVNLTIINNNNASKAPLVHTHTYSDLTGTVPTWNQSTTGNAATATKLATARNIAVSGAVTGSANFDGSGNISIATTATSDPVITLTGAVTGAGTMTNLGNVSIATTATADPTLTLTGDATGSATFTNLGNATLTVAVANDSHTHDGRYYTESEADSRFLNTAGDTLTGTLNYRMLVSQQTTNLDTAGDSSGFSVFYGTSSATGKPSGTDHSVLTLSYSDAWQTQLAGDWRTKELYYRTQENGTWKSWSRIWHDGNFNPASYQPAGTYNTIIGTDSDINTSGSTIIDNIFVTDGVITSMGTRTLTAADIGAAASSHTHDDRYYTESESNARYLGISAKAADANLLDGINSSSFLRSDTSDTVSPGRQISFYSYDTIDTGSGDQASLEVYQDTVGADAFMQFHIGGDFAKYFGLHGGINDFVVGGWSHGASYQRVFHDGYHPNADRWTTSRTLSLTGDASGSTSWDGSGNASISVVVNNDSHTHDGRYYTESEADSRFFNVSGDTITGNLSVNGNTNLGNGNGDTTRINDTLFVEATDSGDSHIYFGENSSGSYGAHLYWDSGVTFNWYTRNAGTDTLLFNYVTNNLSYVNWYRSFHMQNRSIDYLGQIHFNDNVRFYDDGNDSYLNFKFGDVSAGGIRFRDGNNNLHGAVYGDGDTNFGILNSDGQWAFRATPTTSYVYHDGSAKITTSSSGVTVSGTLTTSNLTLGGTAMVANSTSTTSGGLKSRVSGTTLYLTNNGTTA